MYNTQKTVSIIKSFAKQKNISIGTMLSECQLNKNVLSTMQSRGSWIQANNLARIADYLDCSVDYLLGRTDIPEINRTLKFAPSTSEPPALSVRVAAKSGSDYNVHGTDEDTDPVVR